MSLAYVTGDALRCFPDYLKTSHECALQRLSFGEDVWTEKWRQRFQRNELGPSAECMLQQISQRHDSIK